MPITAKFGQQERKPLLCTDLYLAGTSKGGGGGGLIELVAQHGNTLWGNPWKELFNLNKTGILIFSVNLLIEKCSHNLIEGLFEGSAVTLELLFQHKIRII